MVTSVAGINIPKDGFTPEVCESIADTLMDIMPEDELRAWRDKVLGPPWPEEYVNRETKKVYKPHHESERRLVYSDTPRYQYLRGGEGGGKSVAGIIKVLDRVRKGASGIVCSPDLPHF